MSEDNYLAVNKSISLYVAVDIFSLPSGIDVVHHSSDHLDIQMHVHLCSYNDSYKNEVCTYVVANERK